MQRQRQELSQAVRQLTDNSNTLYQQLKPNKEPHQSSHLKKRLPTSIWTETDLDSLISIDHRGSSSSIDNIGNSNRNEFSHHSTTPLYIDVSSPNSSANAILNCSSNSSVNKIHKLMISQKNQESDGLESSGMESDDLLENSNFCMYINIKF